MENKFFKMFGLEGFLENEQGYIDSKVQIVKLEIQEKLTNVITLLLLLISILFLSLMMLAFLSLALGYFLNTLLNSAYLGFLIMGLVFFILILILVFSKKTIHKKIQKITAHFMDITP
jgi:CBS domain containing-hemolysin-like protein